MSTGQEQAQLIFNAMIDMAENFLLEFGEFIPFGCMMKADESIVHVSGSLKEEEHPPQPVIELLQNAFQEKAGKGELIACAIVYDATITDAETGEVGDAVMVNIDTASGFHALLGRPYTLADGKVTFGEVFRQPIAFPIFDHNVN